MIEQEQVQVTQADRDAAKVLWSAEGVGVSMTEDWPEAFARHRIEATAEALEAMREAREALKHRGGPLCAARYSSDDACDCGVSDALTRLTAAIAKIEGQQP
jgi:osmotically-inducible protein OsmY